MKVELLTSRGGPDGSFKPGDIIDVSDAEAVRMFESSPPQAKPVREGRKPEKAAS